MPVEVVLGPYYPRMTDDEDELPKSIGAPATRALAGAGFTNLSQLVGVPAKDLEALHGIGPRAIVIIQTALDERGQSLG